MHKKECLMQGKRLATFLLFAAAIFCSWLWINTYLKEKHPDWYIDPPPPAQNQTSPSTAPTTQTAVAQPTGIHAIAGDGKSAEIGSFKFDRTGTFSQYPLGLTLDA